MKREISLFVALEVFILVSIIFSTPYLINQTNEEKVNYGVVDSVKNFFTIKGFGIVSASSEIAPSCCTETISGATCQNFYFGEEDKCATSLIPSLCATTTECSPGCCIDETTGICSPSTGKIDCDKLGGKWTAGATCQNTDCLRGCCLIRDTPIFTTSANCEFRTTNAGLQNVDFRGLRTEQECLALKETKEEGACVMLGGSCMRTSRENCLGRGDFYKDYLCSNENLNNSCEKQHRIGCAEGLDEIYWYDSCGNRENIYSSNKAQSWNNGMILKKEDSCNPSSGNIGSASCGNCNRFLSSICSASTNQKVNDGNFVCKDLRCSYEGKTYENGESWCIYEGAIGDGWDTVGSEHWLASCVEGEVRIDRCGEKRSKICTQTNIESDVKTFSSANCVVNEANTCLGYGSDATACNKNSHCYFVDAVFSNHFYIKRCLPKYPVGFDLSTRAGSQTASAMCSLANNRCDVVYKRNYKGDWECKENCACEQGYFPLRMNQVCTAMGDCGSYVNYIGTGTNNERIFGTTREGNALYSAMVKWTSLVYRKNPIQGKYVEGRTIDEAMNFMRGNIDPVTGNPIEEAFKSQSDIESVANYVGMVPGAVGLALSSTIIGGTISHGLMMGAVQGTLPMFAANIAGTIQTIGGAATSAAIGAALGYMLGNALGYEGESLLLSAVGGAIMGVLIYIALQGMSLGPVGWAAAAAALAAMAWGFVTGWGDIEIRTVEFHCYPWVPPRGEANCGVCHENPLMPCTDYRCASLGRTCKLINPNTQNPECVSIPRENIAPRIVSVNPFETYEVNEIEYGKYEISPVGGECIPQWTPVNFTIELDEYAECKWSFEKPLVNNYDDMIGDYPVSGRPVEKEHSFVVFMPSVNSFPEGEIRGNIQKFYADATMYIRCADAWDNYNLAEHMIKFCVDSGDDLTPVSHAYTTTSPMNKAKLKYKTNSTAFSMWTNEPAECSYSGEPNQMYSNMKEMNCSTGIEEYNSYGWKCSTNFDLIDGENKFYIKCKDQPWFAGTENESKRNINTEDFVYSVFVSEKNLTITSIEPKGEIQKGFAPAVVDLVVKTDGGSDYGASICKFDLDLNSCDSPRSLFYDTGGITHKNVFNQIMGGYWRVCVKCEDVAGNTASAKTEFEVKLDTSAPIITRSYIRGNQVQLYTDENAKCYYDLERCNYQLENATAISFSYSQQHSFNAEFGQTYYIKCKDIWENTNPECARIIRVV